MPHTVPQSRYSFQPDPRGSARDALDFDHLARFTSMSALQLIAERVQRGRIVVDVGRQEVCRRDIAQEVEPEDGELGEHPPFVGEFR